MGSTTILTSPNMFVDEQVMDWDLRKVPCSHSKCRIWRKGKIWGPKLIIGQPWYRITVDQRWRIHKCIHSLFFLFLSAKNGAFANGLIQNESELHSSALLSARESDGKLPVKSYLRSQDFNKNGTYFYSDIVFKMVTWRMAVFFWFFFWCSCLFIWYLSLRVSSEHRLRLLIQCAFLTRYYTSQHWRWSTCWPKVSAC